MMDWSRLRERDTRPLFQIIRYGIVGVSATLLDVVIFAVLSQWVLPAVDPELGSQQRADRSTINLAIAFFIATVYTYFVNKHCVFVPGRHRPAVEFAIFVGVSAVSFIVGLWFMRHLIIVHDVATYPAKGASIIAAILINYVCRRFLIFKT